MTAFAIIALLAGSVALLRYLIALPLLFRYLRRGRLPSNPTGPTPPMSLLKPLYGADPGLTDNLLGTLQQDYPEFEVLFLHERPYDPALYNAHEAVAHVQDVSCRFVEGRAPDMANPKAAVLVHGEQAAGFDVLVAADSDVRPDPHFLRDIAHGLESADAVSFAPVFFGMRTFGARLAALAVNTDGLVTVVMTNGDAMTGATIGVKREALEHIGGWRAVGDRIADDYSLGEKLKHAGYKLALARRPARLYFPGEDGRESWRWATRWLRTIRSTVPGWYLVGALPACAPVLLLLTAFLTPFTTAALWLLVMALALRTQIAVLVDLRYCRDRSLLGSLHLLPLLWIAEPVAYVAGLFGRTVTWRGRLYRLKRGRVSLPE